MRHPASRHAQSGVTLVIGLIMLVLITLVITTAFSLSTTNLRSVGNIQIREEALAAANIAIEMEVGNPTPFTSSPTDVIAREIDINDDSIPDYFVDILGEDKNKNGALDAGEDADGDGVLDHGPTCVRASQAIHESLSSVTLPAAMSSTPYWNTIWDFDATVTDAHNSGVAMRVRQGIRVLLSEAQKNSVCS